MRLLIAPTEALAWLLTHRAVLTGELTLDEALAPERRPGGHICAAAIPLTTCAMPVDFQKLMARSLELYPAHRPSR